MRLVVLLVLAGCAENTTPREDFPPGALLYLGVSAPRRQRLDV
jgi:hypothetical protein